MLTYLYRFQTLIVASILIIAYPGCTSWSCKTSTPSSSTSSTHVRVITSDEDFKKSIQESSKPVVVKFFAPWCGACTTLSPIVDQLAETMKTECDFIAVNIDQQGAIASSYNINGIPTILVFKQGKALNQEHPMLGVVPQEQLKKTIEDLIKE